jgi:hypothetical protein
LPNAALGERALNPRGEIPAFRGFANSRKKLNAIKPIFEIWRSLAKSGNRANQQVRQFSLLEIAHCFHKDKFDLWQTKASRPRKSI